MAVGGKNGRVQSQAYTAQIPDMVKGRKPMLTLTHAHAMLPTSELRRCVKEAVDDLDPRP